VGRDYAEIFLGHRDMYDGAYIDMREETLQKKHLQCEEVLTISNTKRIERDIRVQADVIGQQEKTITELTNKVKSMEGQQTAIEQMQAEMAILKEIMEARNKKKN
jgi:uncharacterized coiled-coil protein SlyX